ncbi:MAG: hypothetical protein BWZ01_00980 [Deltaproteobacteria bacterium ADurb.BinA179]|nr:hypothetical protein [Deltaproteobacteria bacterium]OPZ28768.1 MAG: hypothetical protein BWZ01_00980 [Deltaproteobacteria bacterium ADurb.BinA179]HOE72051.1 hypothetical protein [Deltaproteobacteria bacterium]HOS25905.1 hypothetical protein [Deltaproteobacteria bacterium]HPV30969.1 hypothetical protein [Deltaproteobacteria bacterium]
MEGHPAPGGIDGLSLFMNDPLVRLMKRFHPSLRGLPFFFANVLIVWLITWLPLLVLSLAGRAEAAGIVVPFSCDFVSHIRFLFVAPLLLLHPLFLEPWIKETLTHLIERGMVDEAAMPRYINAVGKTRALLGSIPVTVFMLGIVILVMLLDIRRDLPQDITLWQFVGTGRSLSDLTPAGWWLYRVSIPVFQFLFLRSILHYLAWVGLLFRVSLLGLRLVPAHPDQAGGIRFLALSQVLFTPWAFGLSSVLASEIGMRIIYGGETLLSFQKIIILFIALFLAALLLPLLAFCPMLVRAKKDGLKEYGLLAVDLLKAFDARWMTGKKAAGEKILSAVDPSATTDYLSTYMVLRGMRFVPFDLRIVAVLLASLIVPMLPLLLTVVSLTEGIIKIVKILWS